jgi:hypothetical protein
LGIRGLQHTWTQRVQAFLARVQCSYNKLSTSHAMHSMINLD